LVEEVINKAEEVQDTDDYVRKGWTYGIPIRKHGEGIAFREKVDACSQLVETY